VCADTYDNPIIWEDLPDLEIIRVDDAYYYTASTFHYSPGAPILRSYDLVHWEYAGHSVPVLDFHAAYDLNGSQAYVDGIWASTLKYRESNQTFYWMGCMHNQGGGYVFTATSPEGPWEKHASQHCYYDMGLLIDDDDTMYVASGNGTISVAELSPDGFSQVQSQQVFETPDSLPGPLEGARFNKINGDYYIFVTQYAYGEYVLRSTEGPFGPYELRELAVQVPFAGAGAGASPHQGGVIETQEGDWYYVGFNDSYPAGRIPVMAPITWEDGWPVLTRVDGEWGASYPFPNLPCGSNRVSAPPNPETFAEPALGHEWEWNHNPDNTKWTSGDGLVLGTATVTDDLYAARNTLTRRMPGPTPTATIELDYSTMQNGDVAGIAALRDVSAWIGVKKGSDGATRVVMTNGVNLDSSWNTSSTGTEVGSAAVSGGKIWLRVEANVRTDGGGGTADFSYSTDGIAFTELGNTLTMNKNWTFFLGYRFGLFNYATDALGGSVTIESFELETP
jgi:beta-xylosidase